MYIYIYIYNIYIYIYIYIIYIYIYISLSLSLSQSLSCLLSLSLSLHIIEQDSQTYAYRSIADSIYTYTIRHTCLLTYPPGSTYLQHMLSKWQSPQRLPNCRIRTHWNQCTHQASTKNIQPDTYLTITAPSILNLSP